MLKSRSERRQSDAWRFIELVQTQIQRCDVAPLAIVKVWECNGGQLEIHGYFERTPQIVWRIHAASIDVEVPSASSFQPTASGRG